MKRWRPVLVALATGSLLLLLAAPAGAHALLKRSNPAAGARVDRAPPQILMFFTEPPDPTLSSVTVLDSNGNVVTTVGKAEPVAGQPNELVVPVKSLPNGVYTVNWRTVSKVDGHVAGNSFAFGVGVAAPSTPAANSGATVSATPAPPPLGVAGRWLLYWGLAVLVAAAATGGLVFGWRLPGGATRLLGAGWLLAAAGIVGMIVAERSVIGVSFGALFGSKTGRELLAQGLAVLLCGLAAAVAAVRPGRLSVGVLGVFAAAAMFVHAQAGHADVASAVRPLNLLDQWIHILSVGVWVGGLVWLLVGLRGAEGDDRARIAGRFSRMALWTVAVLAVSGVLRAVDEMGTVGRLFTTSFGITLLIKTGLFAGVLVIAYVNRSRLVPAVERGGDAGGLRRSVRGEIGLIACVLVAAAVLSELSPAAYVAATAAQQKATQVTASGSDFATTVRVRLTASPGTVGSNLFGASVVDFDTGRPVAARSVQLQFSFPANPNVSSVLDLAKGAGGTWSGRGTNMSIQGQWDIQVVVQEATTAVNVSLHLRTALPPEQITTQPATGQPTLYTIQLGGGLSLQTYVDPGTKPGPNVVHFTFFQSSGSEEAIASATASAITPSGADRNLKLIRFDKGHFASNATLTTGTWTFQISARTGDGKSLSAYFTQRIGS